MPKLSPPGTFGAKTETVIVNHGERSIAEAPGRSSPTPRFRLNARPALLCNGVNFSERRLSGFLTARLATGR
jgi:hypothetical protein